MFSDSNQPRMLRQDIKSLEDTQCVAAYNTIEAILKRDAVHPTQIENTPTYRDTLFNIICHNLDKKGQDPYSPTLFRKPYISYL